MTSPNPRPARARPWSCAGVASESLGAVPMHVLDGTICKGLIERLVADITKRERERRKRSMQSNRAARSEGDSE